MHIHCALLLANGTTKKWAKSNHAAVDYSWKKEVGMWSIRYLSDSPVYMLLLLNGFLLYDHAVPLTFKAVVSSPPHSALSPRCPPLPALHTNPPLCVLSDALWLAARLRVADKANPVNMARDKAIPWGTITTKLARRVQGMEVYALFIFCALGSAAIPHVS